MGLSYANITLEHALTHRQLEVRALVDSGSVFLTIPQHLAIQLGFDLTEGSRQGVPLVGPLRVRFADRHCDLSALVLGDEPLFGAVPMEMMDLVLNPAAQTLTVNPASPYVPTALAK